MNYEDEDANDGDDNLMIESEEEQQEEQQEQEEQEYPENEGEEELRTKANQGVKRTRSVATAIAWHVKTYAFDIEWPGFYFWNTMWFSDKYFIPGAVDEQQGQVLSQHYGARKKHTFYMRIVDTKDQVYYGSYAR